MIRSVRDDILHNLELEVKHRLSTLQNDPLHPLRATTSLEGESMKDMESLMGQPNEGQHAPKKGKKRSTPKDKSKLKCYNCKRKVTSLGNVAS